MKYWISIGLLLCVMSQAFAQHANPFDIGKRRSQEMKIVDPDTSIQTNINIPSPIAPSPTVDLSNPFEKRLVLSSTSEAGTSKTSTEILQLEIPVDQPANRDARLLTFIYSIVMIIIISLAISLDRWRFSTMLKSLFNSNSIKSLYRDKPWTNGQGILLYIAFVFNTGFLIWLYLLKTSDRGVLNLFFLILSISGIYVIRHFAMWTLGKVYPITNEVGLQSYSIALHNMSLGLLLIPVILMVEFVTSLSIGQVGWIMLAFFGIFYLLRQLKGLFFAFNMRGLNPLYFFIYLCALEIAPFLIAIKWLDQGGLTG